MIRIDRSNSPLQLSYILSSEPNPIRASASGANPQIIDLQIYISNPLLDPVDIEEIKIEIPIGADNARTLSAVTSLPQPDPSVCEPWSIKVDAGKITIAAKDGKARQFGREVVIFKLKEIRVNNTPGTVKVTFTEYYDSTSKEDDTRDLNKLESAFPVTKFYADSEVLDNYGSVKFFWECSDQGKNYVYSIYPQGKTPVDCRDGKGECKDSDAGKTGVQSGRLEKTTTFNLDVLKAESGGRYSVYQTLTKTVRVEMPYFHQDCGWIPSVTGRLLQLGWIAENAGKCFIELNNKVVDDNAPTNTSSHNHVLVIGDKPGDYPVRITATSRDGKRRASISPGTANIKDPDTIDVGGIFGTVEVTPDGKLGLLIDWIKDKVVVIDIPNKKVNSTIPLSPGGLRQLAISHDGKYALITGVGIQVMEIATLQVRPEVISKDTVFFESLFTSDSKQAFVSNFSDRAFTIIDMTTLKVSSKFSYGGPRWPLSSKMTPDGKYILMIVTEDGTGRTYFRVLDTKKLQFVGEDVYIGLCLWLGISADSKYALAFAADVIGNERTLKVIDIASRTVIKTIKPPIDCVLTSFVAIPGTKFVLAGGISPYTPGNTIMYLINLDTFELKNVALQLGNRNPFLPSVTPDGTSLLVNGLTEGLKIF